MATHASRLLADEALPESMEICRQVKIWLSRVEHAPQAAAQARANALSLATQTKGQIDHGEETGDGTWCHYLACSHLAHMLGDLSDRCPEKLPIRLGWLAADARSAVGLGASKGFRASRDTRAEEASAGEADWQLSCLGVQLNLQRSSSFSRSRNSLLAQ